MSGLTIVDITSEVFTGERNLLEDSSVEGLRGAKAALESFYYGLNGRNLAALDAVWHRNPHVQLNNPLGGVLRGETAIHDLYQRVVEGDIKVTVRFTDAIAYVANDMIVFAGREKGEYIVRGAKYPLEIRTTRIFGYTTEGWRQLHHHGSIDDPYMLSQYKAAVL